MFVLDREAGLFFLKATPPRRVRYTTDGTVPDGHADLWRGWQNAWDRLRRRHPERADRKLELRAGFTVRSSSFPDVVVRLYLRKGPDQWFSADGLAVRLFGDWTGPEAVIPGSCGFNDSKPYVYVEDLRQAAEFLLTSDVMSA